MKWHISRMDDEMMMQLFNLTKVELNNLLAQSNNDRELVISYLSHQHIQSGARHVALTEAESKYTGYETTVCEWGFSVCKHCGAAEGDWDTNDTCIGHIMETSRR